MYLHDSNACDNLAFVGIDDYMTPRYMRLSETKEAYEVYKVKQKKRHQEKIKKKQKIEKEKTIERFRLCQEKNLN